LPGPTKTGRTNQLIAGRLGLDPGANLVLMPEGA
jgi:hypothetical protein